MCIVIIKPDVLKPGELLKTKEGKCVMKRKYYSLAQAFGSSRENHYSAQALSPSPSTASHEFPHPISPSFQNFAESIEKELHNSFEEEVISNDTITDEEENEIRPECKNFTTDFNDPIHGNISIGPLCLRIIDTSEFQRLDKLKQLGVSNFVFRGATHTRFSHSIGVAFLASKVVKILRESQPHLDITPADLLCVTVAGLCHDLGHGPFSHVYDNSFINRRVRERQERAGLHYKEWRHEDASVDMFRLLLRTNHIDLARYDLSAVDQTFIEEIIRGTKEKDRIGRPVEKFYLYDIVNNNRSGLDMDKVDYFRRDMFYTNALGSSAIKFDRFIEMGRVYKAEPIASTSVSSSSSSSKATGKKRSAHHQPMPSNFASLSRKISESSGSQRTDYGYMICYPQKLASEVLDLFSTRFRMHQAVYTHKTVRGVENMICDVLEIADPIIRIPGSRTAEFPSGLYRISECVCDATALSNLNDSIIDTIKLTNDPHLKRAQDILRRLERRDVYPCVGKMSYPRENRAIGCLSEAEIRSAIVNFTRVSTGRGAQQEERDNMRMSALNMDETLDDITIINTQDSVHSLLPNEVTQDAYAANGESLLLSQPEPQLSQLSQYVINEDDVIVEKLHIHYGLKEKNPIINIRFYEKNADQITTIAQPIAVSHDTGLNPCTFEEFAVRVFCRYKKGSPKIEVVKRAFCNWWESMIDHDDEEEEADDEEEK